MNKNPLIKISGKFIHLEFYLNINSILKQYCNSIQLGCFVFVVYLFLRQGLTM